MAASFVVHDATGASSDFAVTFPYFEVAHLEVRVNNVIVGFTPISTSVIRLAFTPAAGSRVSIRRRTPATYTVPPAKLPLLVRYFNEEAMDLAYNFDAVYGNIQYDIVFSLSNLPAALAEEVAGAVRPNLALSLDTLSTFEASVAPTGNIEGRIEGVNAGVTTQLATFSLLPGQTSGTVTRLFSGAIPAATRYRMVITTGSTLKQATLLLRLKRL